MDDPWGSPWAMTDPEKDQKLASPVKSDIALPPRAFLSASSSPGIPAILEQSPWGGDDDGCGEWATVSDAPSAPSVWAGGWKAASPSLASPPREDVMPKTSPIAWPGTVATPKPANGSAFSAIRQPSPDPWASEIHSQRASNSRSSTPRLVVDVASPLDPPIDTLGKDGLGIEEDPGWDTSEAVDEKRHTTTPLTPGAFPRDFRHTRAEEAQAPDSDVQGGAEPAVQGREDHLSTPSNDNTDNEDERQDSSVTSVEEEPGTAQLGARRPSGKVRELVVKFDGLARAASQERIPIQRDRSASPLSVRKRDEPDDGCDFGDFEDADPDEPSLTQDTPASTGPGEGRTAVVASAVSGAIQGPLSPASPIAKFGPLDFGVDPGLIEQLFPSGPTKRDSKPDEDVPDHIINDSFTEISQRKTWYRISRLGSSRRHNAADDESYRRVAWPTSTVHDDTIKIVRRWMEEDSITGRVTLGGGISKTQKNMFGWDSSAEPVGLDAVFGRKKSHSRASSLQPLHLPGRDGMNGPGKKSLRSPTHRPSGSAGPVVASFGWNSKSPSSEKQSYAAKEVTGSNIAAGTPPKPLVCATNQGLVSQRPAARQTGPGSQARLQHGDDMAHAADNDEDDEWGEMVSSPIVRNPNNNNDAAKPMPDPSNPDNKPLQATPADDPWASADLSVFESAFAQPPPQFQVPAGVAELSGGGLIPPQPRPDTPATLSSLRVSESSPMATIPPATSTTTATPPRGIPKRLAHDLQSSHDEAAERIISNLPDLSYMLR